MLIETLYHNVLSPSSTDLIDGRGPLRQPTPGVSTTASPGPLGTNAKRCAVGDLLDPRVAWATCSTTQDTVGRASSPAPTGRAGAVRIATTCNRAG